MTKSEQEPLVQECRNSGMTVRAWCREHSISYSTYMGWSKNFPVEHAKQVKHTQGTSQQWVALETVITAPAKDSSAGKKPDHISLNFGKWSMRVEKGIDAELLADVLRAVNTVCC